MYAGQPTRPRLPHHWQSPNLLPLLRLLLLLLLFLLLLLLLPLP
jgi:hypothetical protein